MNDTEWFLERYGKIRVMDSIPYRNPVKNTCVNDRNRALMLKFKYGNLTASEEYQFHEAMKNLIYKVMHTNCVMMDWDDVYQEIWRKICRSKHTWDEDKGTYVSTWITIVASTVISTLRTNVSKYNSRFVRYDDIPSSSDSGDGGGADYKMDSLTEEAEEDMSMRASIWREQYDYFLDMLEPAERSVMQGITSMEDKFLSAAEKEGGRRTMPFNALREKMGYDEATFNIILYNIRRKYCDAFDQEFVESSSSSSEAENFMETLF